VGRFLVYVTGITLLFAGAAVLAWYYGVLRIILEITGYIPTIVIIAVAVIIVGAILIKGAFLIEYDTPKRNSDNGFNEFEYDEVMYRDGNATRKRF
jgi:drug/metabolite transporter (DMT)-like permease